MGLLGCLRKEYILDHEKFQGLRREYGLVYGRGYRYYEDLDETYEPEFELRRGDVSERFAEIGNFICSLQKADRYPAVLQDPTIT